MPKPPPFADPNVKAAFAGFPQPARRALKALRALVFDAAKAEPAIGALVETLKWGEPAYLPEKPRVGTTVRLGLAGSGTLAGAPEKVALFVHCQTTLVEDFRALYGDTLTFEGNRAIVLDAAKALPEAELKHCIAMALTYHRAKRRSEDTTPGNRHGRKREAVRSA